jgi:hypothetical protein
LSFFERHKSHGESFYDELLCLFEVLVNAHVQEFLVLEVRVSDRFE